MNHTNKIKMTTQPAQQEPVGVKFNEGLWQEYEARIAQLDAELMRMHGRELKLQFALAEQPAPVQQEPVGWFNEDRGILCKDFEALGYGFEPACWQPLYTSPQPAQRKPLTDDEWQSIADTLGCFITRGQKDAIESTLGIKGDA